MKQCLVLGPVGVGKTSLIKTLRDNTPVNTKKQQVSDQHQLTTAYQPTVGTNLIDCQVRKGVLVTLKECGGVMAPLWNSSLDDADMLIYVVDCSNNIQISTATVLLMEILGNQKMDGKPVLLFYNKTDIATGCPLSLKEFKETMRVRDLVRKYGENKLAVLSGSCLTGENRDNIYKWLGRHS